MYRNGLFPEDDQTISLMRAAKPGARLLWDRDTKGCPAEIDGCGIPIAMNMLAASPRSCRAAI